MIFILAFVISQLLAPVAEPVPEHLEGSVVQNGGRGFDDDTLGEGIVFDIDDFRVIQTPQAVVFSVDVERGDGNTSFQFVRKIANRLSVQIIDGVDARPLEDFFKVLLVVGIHCCTG